MKKIDSYVISSLLKISVTTIFLIATVLVLFETFSQIEHYLNGAFTLKQIAYLTYLFIPETLITAVGPSLLFSTTYFLAMMYANNEMIILANSGYPYKRIVKPIIVLALVFTLLLTIFSENIGLKYSLEHNRVKEQYFALQSDGDNWDIVLQSYDGSYVIYASNYWDYSKKISDITILVFDESGEPIEKIEAASGTYNGKYWDFKDVKRAVLDFDTLNVELEYLSAYSNPDINLESSLFRNNSNDIKSMPLQNAYDYLKKIKIVNKEQYQKVATDFYNRIVSNLYPLILVLISISTVFTWRKSVLVLSILASLIIAVIYFVVEMVSIIFAKQAVITPLLGSLTPIVVTLLLVRFFSLFRRI